MTTSPAFTGIYGTRRLRCLEVNICKKDGGSVGPLRRSERVRGALDEFVSEFGFGKRQPRDSGATNLLRGSLIKARCRLVSWE